MNPTEALPPVTALSLLTSLAPVTKIKTIEGVGNVCVRQVSVRESDDIREKSKDAAANEFGLRLVIASLVDEGGAPLLTLAELPSLQAAADATMAKLVEAVLEVNGYKKAALPNAQS